MNVKLGTFLKNIWHNVNQYEQIYKLEENIYASSHAMNLKQSTFIIIFRRVLCGYWSTTSFMHGGL